MKTVPMRNYEHYGIKYCRYVSLKENNTAVSTG